MKTKIILLILSLSISTNAFCQKLEDLGKNNNPNLTELESLFLNKYLSIEQKNGIEIKDKKVIFVTGSNGGTLSNKYNYFNQIKEWHKNESKIQTFVIELNEKDKINSGGYDIIIAYWVKVFTNKTKQKIIDEVKASR